MKKWDLVLHHTLFKKHTHTLSPSDVFCFSNCLCAEREPTLSALRGAGGREQASARRRRFPRPRPRSRGAVWATSAEKKRDHQTQRALAFRPPRLPGEAVAEFKARRACFGNTWESTGVWERGAGGGKTHRDEQRKKGCNTTDLGEGAPHQAAPSAAAAAAAAARTARATAAPARAERRRSWSHPSSSSWTAAGYLWVVGFEDGREEDEKGACRCAHGKSRQGVQRRRRAEAHRYY